MITLFILCAQAMDSIVTNVECEIDSSLRATDSAACFLNSMKPGDWVTSILSLLAIIISVLFSLIPYFKKSKMNGKLISIRILPKGMARINCEEYKGDIYIIKLCLYCANKNYPLKGIDIKMRYKNGWKDAINYYPKSVNFTEDGEEKQLIIPAESYLPFNGVIPSDENNHYYINFVVPGLDNDYPFEEMELTLNSYKKKKSIKLHFKKEDIDFGNMLVEDHLLTRASKEADNRETGRDSTRTN